MEKVAWVMAEIGMGNSNSNEELVKISKIEKLKQTPADMTGNELDFNVKRRKKNMTSSPQKSVVDPEDLTDLP